MKLEATRARHPQLLYESKVYRLLQGGVGIPHVRYLKYCVLQKILLFANISESFIYFDTYHLFMRNKFGLVYFN